MKSASREDDFELKMDLLRKRQISTKNNQIEPFLSFIFLG